MNVNCTHYRLQGFLDEKRNIFRLQCADCLELIDGYKYTKNYLDFVDSIINPTDFNNGMLEADKELRRVCKNETYNDYPEIQPPDIVKEYETINNKGEIKILEWYEGDYFNHGLGGGYWVDRDSDDCEEITNIIKWRNID